MGRGYGWAWSEYYWNYLKEVGRETYKTFRLELFSAILVAVVSAYVSHGWKDFRVYLLSSGVVLGGFVVAHAVRAPWLLHKSEVDPGDAAGIFGVFAIVVVLIGGIGLAWVLWNARASEVIESKIQAPAAPKITIETENVIAPAPGDIQLEIDAYQLADNIEAWWTSPDTWSKTDPYSETQPSDYGRFFQVPPTWNPGRPNRNTQWARTLEQEYNGRFRVLVVALIERFKGRGIEIHEDMPLETGFGPKTVRQTIEYLRKAATQLDSKRQSP